MAELLGTHSYQLDPKGRISLPGRFREAFADGAVLTLGQDGCLFCFPRAEWTARAAEIRDLPLSDTEGRAYARMFFGKAESLTLDGQGRLLVPQRLRNPPAVVVKVPELQVEGAHQGKYALQVGSVTAAKADDQVHKEGVDPRRHVS